MKTIPQQVDDRFEQVKIADSISVAVRLLYPGDKFASLERTRDKIFYAIREQLKSEERLVPEYLLRYCANCGSYKNVFTPGTLCQSCESARQYKPNPGSLKRYVYHMSAFEEGVPDSFLQKISGEKLPDVAFQYTLVAYKRGFHDWLMGDGEFGGDYYDDKLGCLTVLEEKLELPAYKPPKISKKK